MGREPANYKAESNEMESDEFSDLDLMYHFRDILISVPLVSMFLQHVTNFVSTQVNIKTSSINLRNNFSLAFSLDN